MLKKYPLALATAGSLCAVFALAQEAPPADTAATSAPAAEKKVETPKPTEHSAVDKPASKPTPKPAATPAPVSEVAATPTPRPRKASFFERFFGTRKRAAATPTPTPLPVSTPAPHYRTMRKVVTSTPVPEPVSTPKPGRTPKPTTTSKLDMPKVAPATTPKASSPETSAKVSSQDSTKVPPAATPARTASTASVVKLPSTTSTAKVPTATPSKKTVLAKPPVTEPKKPLVEPPADADPDVKERFRFDQAKEKALDDPQVRSLKAKADDASTDDESRKALRAYNKALFEKIRKIDGSVAERADRLEAAILKRLSE